MPVRVENCMYGHVFTAMAEVKLQYLTTEENKCKGNITTANVAGWPIEF